MLAVFTNAANTIGGLVLALIVICVWLFLRNR